MESVSLRGILIAKVFGNDYLLSKFYFLVLLFMVFMLSGTML